MNMYIHGQHLCVHHLGYQHHGIGIGDNQVLHYGTRALIEHGFHFDEQDITQNTLCLVSLDEFRGGIFTYYDLEFVEHYHRIFDDCAAVERGLALLNDGNSLPAFTDSIEFVNWCIEGVLRLPETMDRWKLSRKAS